MNAKRRKLIQAAAVASAAASVGTLLPQRVLGAYAKAAFDAKDVSGALNESLGGDQHSASDQIKLKAPEIAENGAVVPITVSSKLDKVEAISILATENASPLTSTYSFTSASEPYVSTRIKMAKTSDIIAVVKADGKLYSATREVKVTIGGCGG